MNTEPEPTPGERLKAARDATGLRIEDASYLARQQLRHIRCSRETIRRYEGKIPEERWTPEIVLALSQVYGVSLESLSPIAAERLGSVLTLMRGDDPPLQNLGVQNLKRLNARRNRSNVRPRSTRPRNGGPKLAA